MMVKEGDLETVDPGSYRVTYRGVAVDEEVAQTQVTIGEPTGWLDLLIEAENKLPGAFKGAVEVTRVEVWDEDDGWVEP